MGNLQKKNIDLLRAYRQHSTKKNDVPMWAKLAIPPLVLFLILTSLFAYGTLESNRYRRELKEAKSEIAALEANGTNEQINKLQDAVTTNKKKVSNLQKVLDNLDTYPRLQRSAIDTITTACGTTVNIKDMTFDENYGTITITAQTAYVYETSDLITRLKKSGAFSSVYYSGYYEKSEVETAAGTDEEKNASSEQAGSDEKNDEKQEEDAAASAKVKKNAAGFYELSIVCVLKAGV